MKPLLVPFFISQQGCSHGCVYCNQKTISGSPGQLPSPGEIVSRLGDYRATAEGRQLEVAYYGGTFTALPAADQERLLQPLQPLLASGAVSAIRVSTRPDAVDPAVSAFLREMGVRTVELGVQSLDDRVLARAERGHTAADALAAIGVLQRTGLKVGVQLMIGLPGDTHGGALLTVRRVLACKPSFLRFYPTLVIAGTPLEKSFLTGEYVPMTLDEAVGCCKSMLHEALRAHVPVVRGGLQDTADLRYPGNLVAGPHHPAFRQLVEGELFFDLMQALTREVPAGSELTLVCAPSRVSEVVGHCRVNVKRLREGRNLRVAGIREEKLFSAHELQIVAGDHVRKGNIVDNLNVHMEVTRLGR
jgi:histone acetyltransferase (RNA polymerase elongator complex component)